MFIFKFTTDFFLFKIRITASVLFCMIRGLTKTALRNKVDFTDYSQALETCSLLNMAISFNIRYSRYNRKTHARTVLRLIGQMTYAAAIPSGPARCPELHPPPDRTAPGSDTSTAERAGCCPGLCPRLPVCWTQVLVRITNPEDFHKWLRQQIFFLFSFCLFKQWSNLLYKDNISWSVLVALVFWECKPGV